MQTLTLTEVETVQYSMQDTDVAHLAGVFDIAGNLAIEVKEDASYAQGYKLQPVIAIRKLREDNPVVGKLMEYCEEEIVKYYMLEREPGIEIRVQRESSIKRLLEPMVPYLVTNYTDAELMLNGVLPAMANDKDKTKDGIYELIGMAEKLRLDTTHRTEVKYTQDYFAEEWSLSQ